MNRRMVVLAGLILSLLAASPAEAARTEYFGISQGRELDNRDLQGMTAARVRTSRFLLQWRTVQPVQGVWDWRQPDRVIGGLASHGIRPFPFAWGSPQWVRPGPSRPPVTSTFAQNSWQNFLKAAVARYGPTGRYWTTRYRQVYGANATPLPITSWQVWNEPNLKKYFDPGNTTGHGIDQYAQLVRISHAAIKSRDPQARIVLGGVLGYGDPLGWDFLKGLYKRPGVKDRFDVAALHPYTGSLDRFRSQILLVRGVMKNHGDAAAPLWLTEFGWGSAPPDRFGINKGLYGQAQMLTDSFEMLLRNRQAWNVQRLYWFLWRDPPSGGGTGCSFCGSAGLLRYKRLANPPYENRKPSYWKFRSFATETIPPGARITGGPAQGGFTTDRTPSFFFAVTDPVRDAGSTFVCRRDGGLFKPCTSPFTTPALSYGGHVFYVKAIDAPGNESPIVSRSFTVRAP
jgi:Glycosyl hydrolase catalytic core